MKYNVLLIFLIIGSFSLNASDIINNKNSNNLSKDTENKAVDVKNNERGFAYNKNKIAYSNEQENSTGETVKGKNLLNDIKLLLEQQLKTQKEILAVLQEEYSPKPKMIIGKDGEPCIANSSAECFQMPITAEAKRIPVIKEWMQKGTIESSVKKKQWMAEYFNRITKGAYSDVAAIAQFGSKAYPVNYNTMNYNNTTGYGNVLKPKIDQNVFEKNLDKVNFVYFIGENEDMDLYSMDNITKLLDRLEGKIRLQFIFKNEKAMKSYQIAEKHNPEFAVLNKFKMSVNEAEFKNFGIYNSPSLVAINKEKKTAQTILVGRASPDRTIKMALMYMRNEGIIKDADLNVDNGWKENSDYGKNYVKDFLGNDFLKEIGK